MKFDALPTTTDPHPTERLEDFCGRDWPVRRSLTIAETVAFDLVTVNEHTDIEDVAERYQAVATDIVKARLDRIARLLAVPRTEFDAAVKAATKGDVTKFSLPVLDAILAWLRSVVLDGEVQGLDPSKPQ